MLQLIFTTKDEGLALTQLYMMCVIQAILLACQAREEK